MARMYSNTDIIKELKRVYATIGDAYTRRQYEKYAAISKTTVENRFGTWSEALKKAGLFKRFQKAKKTASRRKVYNA